MRDSLTGLLCVLLGASTCVQCQSSARQSQAAAGGMAGAMATAGAPSMGGSAMGGSAGAAPMMDTNTQPLGDTAYRPCPETGEPCRILPLGDSITFGVGEPGGYRVPLFRKALAAQKSLTFVGSLADGPEDVDGVPFPKNHEGHSGWEIGQLDELIPAPALDPLPDIVLLMAGTNDCAHVNMPDTAPARLGKLLDDITSNNEHVLVVVARPIPMIYDDKNVCVQNIGAMLPGLVQERVKAGKHLVLVNQYTGFPLTELGDGLHPNANGYARMAGVWFDFLGEVLP